MQKSRRVRDRRKYLRRTALMCGLDTLRGLHEDQIQYLELLYIRMVLYGPTSNLRGSFQ